MSLAERRKKAGFSTQEQLAVQINKNRSIVAKFEIGMFVPRWETLKSIASALNCSVDEILIDFERIRDQKCKHAKAAKQKIKEASR